MPNTDKQITYIIIREEGLIASVTSDLITFGLMLLCIYASQQSAFWSIVSGTMFLAFLVALVNKRRDGNVFHSPVELAEWAQQRASGESPLCDHCGCRHWPGQNTACGC